jgi:hypothetical protein
MSKQLRSVTSYSPVCLHDLLRRPPVGHSLTSHSIHMLLAVRGKHSPVAPESYRTVAVRLLVGLTVLQFPSVQTGQGAHAASTGW